jgi:DNA-binding XRE family transcriptional regulator
MKNKVGRPKENNQICGKSLYYHRLAHKMSQGEIAKKIGLSIRTISRIENEPDFKTTRVTAYKVAYEIIFNPVPDHPEVLELINKWNGERNGNR